MKKQFRSMPRLIRFTIIASIIVFAASLALPAVTIAEGDEVNTFSSTALVTMGGMSIISGAIVEWLIWLANPVYLLSLFLLVAGRKTAIYTSTLAFVLAFSFIFKTHVVANDRGEVATVVALHEGYWFWLASIFILAAGMAITGARKLRTK